MTALNEDLDLYLRVREREGRLYSDETVRQLPSMPADHPLHDEWRARAASADRLTAYLGRLPKPVAVLDLGCGNGWLSHRIAISCDSFTVGLDRDGPELHQARRAFARHDKLSWIAADIFRPPFADGRFDVIVVASAIQYFADLSCLINTLFPLLSTNGEIHILDSPLYSHDELPAARDRSRRYYQRLGIPEMAAHYHHHSRSVLEAYNPLWLYMPRHEPHDSPFPWVCLRKHRQR